MTINQQVKKVKNHLSANKKIYLVGAGALTVGAVVGLGFGTKQIVITDAWTIKWKSPTTNNVIVELIERSTPSKPVHLVGTDLYFASLSDAARKTGHSLSQISKNVNGHIPDVHGDKFELITLS